MKPRPFHSASTVETERLGNDIAMALAPGDLVLLDGDLGAGKTLLACAIIRSLADDPALEVPSPTFTLVQTYGARAGFDIAHLDLYRLDDPQELDELGLDEALETGIALVEWPQKGDIAETDATLVIRLADTGGDSRSIELLPQSSDMQDRLDRSLLIRQRLDEWRCENARRSFLTGDASARCYETIHSVNEAPRILMNAPAQPDGPPVYQGRPYSAVARLAEDMGAFEGIDRMLASAGLAVPDLLAVDLSEGLLLISHLGEGRIVDEGNRPIAARYKGAIDVLVAMHRKEWPGEIALSNGGIHRVSPYDPDAMRIELSLLTDWYLPHRAEQPSTRDADAFFALWETPLQRVQSGPQTLVLRDHHSPNIIWREDEEGLAQVGLIDFQDAVIGPQAYDVASLAQDARVDIPEALERELLDHYCMKRRGDSGFDESEFRAHFAIMAAQRASKILGIFVRLSKRDGKHAYLAHLPRIRNYLDRALAHDALAELRGWVKTVLDS